MNHFFRHYENTAEQVNAFMESPKGSTYLAFSFFISLTKTVYNLANCNTGPIATNPLEQEGAVSLASLELISVDH